MTRLECGSATDVGRVRTVNEDRFLVADSLFAVADGLGGHQAGEVASKTAVETLGSSFNEHTVDGLVDAVLKANHAVWQLARDNPDLQGMATTMTAVALVDEDDEERLALVNVGDSRAYLLQRGELEQLTEDHSLVEQLVREGRLTSEEAAIHPQRSIITRALGLDPDVEVDSWQLIPYQGDRLLLCSDGLTNEVTDDDIASTLRRVTDPGAAAQDLVEQARAHGGNDNITVVVVDVVDDDGRAKAASAALAQDEAAEGRTADKASRAAAAEPVPADALQARAERSPSMQTGVHQRVPAARPQPVAARGVTWRVIAFAAALLAVLLVVVAAVGWYARKTYYVGLSGTHVAIFKGRPGGLLWFEPSVEQRQDLRVDDVLPARRLDLKAGHSEPSLASAQRYVTQLRQEATARRAVPPSPVPGTGPGTTIQP
jgi:serine/threonine protein phosphatase PrpC